jgi:hypothetical protein
MTSPESDELPRIVNVFVSFAVTTLDPRHIATVPTTTLKILDIGVFDVITSQPPCCAAIFDMRNNRRLRGNLNSHLYTKKGARGPLLLYLAMTQLVLAQSNRGLVLGRHGVVGQDARTTSGTVDILLDRKASDWKARHD